MASSNSSTSSIAGSQNPANEEPLPVALHQLLAELGTGPWPAAGAASRSASSSNTPPLRSHFADDLSQDGYGHFFKPSRSLGGEVKAAERERWRQLRVQVLTAIGRCRTLDTIVLRKDPEVGEDGRAEEVEALLGGLASISDNSALHKLGFAGGLDNEAACVALGALLRCSRTLRELILAWAGMDAAGLRHVVSGLQANPYSALQLLNLSHNPTLGEGGGAAQIAALLDHTLCPSLRHVDIKRTGLDVAGAQMVAQVLAWNTLLRALKIGHHKGADGLGMLLRTGLGETRRSGLDADLTLGNRSIINLQVWAMSYECVSDMNLVFRTNPVLEECHLLLSDCSYATAGLELDKMVGLKTLSLTGQCSTAFMKTVFSSLGENETLHSLNLHLSNGSPLDKEDIFTDLMQSLNRNTLEDIEYT